MSLDSEQAVFGAILYKPESFWQIADVVTDSDFSTAKGQALVAAVRELLTDGKPVDPWTVSAHDKRLSTSELVDLLANSTGSANIRAYAEIVQKQSERRKLKAAGVRISACQTFADAQEVLADVRPQTAARLSTMKEASKSMYDEVVRRYDHDGSITGITTTIAGLDDMTGGLKGGQLVIIAARPSMGKSAFANQLGIKAPRAYISTLEMSKRQLAERAAANMGNFPYRWMTNPKDDSSSEVWARLTAVVPLVNALDWVIDDSAGLTADVICARIRQTHMAKPLSVAVIDHLGIISRPGRNDAAELGQITTMLKGLAKDLDIPVVLLAQLNRKVEDRADKRPALSDLRDSGRIEEDADIVVLLYRPEYYGLEPAGYVEFMVAKNRDGETGSAWAQSRLANMRLESCEAPERPEPKQVSRGFGR
jgi:replicative DNA helicase